MSSYHFKLGAKELIIPKPLQLRYYGDPVLRQKAEPIEAITAEIEEFAYDMISIVKDKNMSSWALAANQVGVPLRIFVMAYSDDPDEDAPAQVFINPRFYEPSEERVFDHDACMSIPGFYSKTWRPYEIHYEATDLAGKKFSGVASGMRARVMMHENDHLNGVLFIDRLENKEKKQFLDWLRRFQAKQKKA